MGRPKGNVNPIHKKRLEEFLKEVTNVTGQRITQTGINKLTGISQQTISKIMNGHANLTETTAQVIVDAFPEVDWRYQYLLGYDDYKTEKELTLAPLFQAHRDSNLLSIGFYAYAKLCDISISDRWDEVREIPKTGSTTFGEALGNLYTLSYNGKKVTLGLEEMSQLENEIYRFVKFRLMELFDGEG